MIHQYEMLEKILDHIRMESPPNYKSYRPTKDEKEALTKARSLAFIHLFLKVRFGTIDFQSRHQQISDGPNDGGLDAHYIDEENKQIFFIQSKYRSSDRNFKAKSIRADDLIRMEIKRITSGEETDSNGKAFNKKIKAFQEKIKEIRDIAKYEYIVILLGNSFKLNDEQIRRLIENCKYEIYDAQDAYEKLVFPLASGTYYNPDEIIIKLELSQKENPRLEQQVETDFGKYNVLTIFVPTVEVGRVMSKYKNAILKYNPRNFLSLQKKSVNESIRNSILKHKKNNFSILNNGITILSDNVDITVSTGKKNEGQLILTKPQILNGGQTAYTLSEIYEVFLNKSNNPLMGKEVLMKIITPISGNGTVITDFIELISNATNQQNEVSEADRRSNHEIQILLQSKIYKEFGYFYERKSGEFHDGIKDGFIDKKLVVNRLAFIKAYWAYLGEPAAARRTSEKIIFREENFYKILRNVSKYREMFFSYLLFNELEKIEGSFQKKSDSIDLYGYSILYGKWAVLSSIGIASPKIDTNSKEMFEQVKKCIKLRLSTWKEFEKFIRKKRKDSKYFKDEPNFELFYKVSILDEDIKEFFRKRSL